MFSKISKSFRGRGYTLFYAFTIFIIILKTSGSLGNLIYENTETSDNHPSYIREYSSSVVSDFKPSSIGRSKEKTKSKRSSRMFSSDYEDDEKSDVYINPNLNLRSMSMVRFILNKALIC